MQGKSVLPMLGNPKHINHQTLPLINVWGARPSHSLAVVSKDWKYINWFYGADGYTPTEELYSMKNDRLENSNLSASPEQRGMMANMRKQYDAWLGVWAKEGVQNNGYQKYLKLADRNFDWSKAEPELLESMGAIDEATRNGTGKEKSVKKSQKKARKETKATS